MQRRQHYWYNRGLSVEFKKGRVMDPRIWSLDSAQFSEEFLLFLRYGLISCLVAGVVLAVIAAMTSGSGWRPFEDSWDGQKPVLLALSAVSLPASIAYVPTGWNLFAATFVLGLACGLTSSAPFLKVRDTFLSVAGLVVSGLLIARIIGRSDLSTRVFVIFVALSLIGFVLSGAGMLSRTSIGLSVLGGIDVLLFLQSPFGVEYVAPGASEVSVGAAAALVMGAMTGLRPAFTISLGVASVTALGLVLQLFLWFERENFPSSPLGPDWKFAIALLGVGVGYGLMGLPVAMAQQLRSTTHH